MTTISSAQSADEAAIPVRKNEDPKIETAAAKAGERKFGLLKKTTSEEAAARAISDSITKSSGSGSKPASASKPAAAASPAGKAPAPRTASKAETAAKPAPTAKPPAKAKPSPARPAASKDSTDADMAALDNLRPGSSAAAKKADSEEKKAGSGETATSRKASTDDRASERPEPLRRSAESETAAAEDSPPAAVPAPAPPPAVAMAPAPQPAAAVSPAPNLYLPQATPQSRGGLFSRLFQRKSNAPARPAVAPAQVPAFNSDYSTRSSDDVCPVYLPGFGLNGNDLPIGYEDSYRLTSSLPADFRPTDLVLLPSQFCHYGNALYLRREAAASLCQMINAAAREGLTIRVVSAYRDYNHQLRLYTRAVARGGENQQSVARPGRSEHFLGTTVDLTNNESHVLKRSFGDTPEGRWLAANAATYGWKMTVMAGNGRRSHNDEPWHLRYLGSTINNPSGISPIAQPVSQPQSRDVFGRVGRFLGLRR